MVAENSKCLVVIPARGGSKGLPRKNISDVAGKPLIAWTIECARDAECVERTIVSTDTEEIAEAARRCGAEVPFLRPAELAQDDTPGIAPLLHAIDWLSTNEGYFPEWVMLLQATSPLRIAQDIDDAFAFAQRCNAQRVVSLTPAKHHPYWMKQIDSAGRLSDFVPLKDTFDTRQTLPSVYAPNGAIYLIRREALLTEQTFFGEEAYGHVMPVERSLDIDSAWDLRVADMVLRARSL